MQHIGHNSDRKSSSFFLALCSHAALWVKEAGTLKIYEYLFKEGVGEAFRTVSCCFHTAAYFIKRLSSRRKASSEQRGGGAESLFLICLHYNGWVGFTQGDWGGCGSLNPSCCWWNLVCMRCGIVLKHGNIVKEQCLHHRIKLVLWNDLMCHRHYIVI